MRKIILMQRYMFGSTLTACALTTMAVVAACSDSSTASPEEKVTQDAGTPGEPVPDMDADNVTEDAGSVKVELPKCDVAKPFGAPTQIPELSTTASSPSLSDDELTVIYSDKSISDPGTVTLFEARRANFKAPFGKPTELSALHVTGYREESPRIAADGLSVLFASNRPGGTGTSAISGFYLAERTSGAAPFQVLGMLDIPTIVGSGTEFTKATPFLTRDGLELWFQRLASDPIQDAIWSASISAAGDIGSPVERLVDAEATAFAPILSNDGLSLYYTVNDGAASGLNVWRAERAATNAPFTRAAKIVELSSTGDDWLWHISADGCRAYLRSTRTPVGLYVAARPL